MKDAANWLKFLLQLGDTESHVQFAVMEMARRTDDRHRDVSAAVRDEAVRWLEDSQAPAHLVELVRDGGRLDSQEQDQVFGEALPKGLRLRSD